MLCIASKVTIQRPRYDTYHDTGLHLISPQNNLVKQLFIKHCILWAVANYLTSAL